MSAMLDIQTTQDQLIKILKDGFTGGLQKTLTQELQKEFEEFVKIKLSEIEKRMQQEVETVVNNYSKYIRSVHPDHLSGQLVVQVVFEKKGE